LCQDVLRRLDKTFQAFFARVKRAAVPLPASAESSGIDVGWTHFAALSDGTSMENPGITKRHR
jgi:hypothetical protein